jgi:uncharacterized protein (TIGR02266 family)
MMSKLASVRLPNEPERRAQPRVLLEVPVDLETENNFYAGVAGDVSEGGVFVATHVAPPVGTSVVVRLTLPGEGEPLELDGVVCWLRDVTVSSDGMPPGCGVKWVDLPIKGKGVIARFVKERDPILFEV